MPRGATYRRCCRRDLAHRRCRFKWCRRRFNRCRRSCWCGHRQGRRLRRRAVDVRNDKLGHVGLVEREQALFNFLGAHATTRPQCQSTPRVSCEGVRQGTRGGNGGRGRDENVCPLYATAGAHLGMTCESQKGGCYRTVLRLAALLLCCQMRALLTARDTGPDRPGPTPR